MKMLKPLTGLASILIGLGHFGSSAFAMGKPLPTRTGDYCRDEVEDFIRAKFGPKVQFKQYMALGNDENYATWIRTNLCDGYIVAEFNARRSTCKMAQYVSYARGLVRIWGYGACRRVIPRDLYPRY